MSCYIMRCYAMLYYTMIYVYIYIYVNILYMLDILWSFRSDKTCRSLEFLVQLQGGAGVPKGFESPLVSLDLCQNWGIANFYSDTQL